MNNQHPVPEAARLRITEIFHSLQGEGTLTGTPTVFVRLTGCPLRCTYCDTSYAFQGGEWMTLTEILEKVTAYRCPTVCVTGGEPLAQPATPELLRRLCDAGFQVSLETSGALDLGDVDPRVIKVMDIKTPDSGEAGRNRWENLKQLNRQDQIKLVINSHEDYLWARELVEEKRLADICTVLFSPAAPTLNPTQLAEWILEDRLPVRFQIQLHKVLWGDSPGH
ncbi:MAG: 7-carboxy-7-deazaguanine synthase QueE [Gammaproteobacteria bacterium]